MQALDSLKARHYDVSTFKYLFGATVYMNLQKIFEG